MGRGWALGHGRKGVLRGVVGRTGLGGGSRCVLQAHHRWWMGAIWSRSRDMSAQGGVDAIDTASQPLWETV